MRLEPDDLERFLRNVPAFTARGCWLWQGGRFEGTNYGRFKLRGLDLGAHRVMWLVMTGELHDEREVCHACDNRPCVRPLHLFVGTPAENTADAIAKDRRHGLTAAEVFEIRSRATEPQGALAREFGVSQSSISRVIQRKVWRDL